MNKSISDLLDVNDISQLLGIGKSTTYKLLKKELPAFKIANQWRCTKSDLLDYLERKKSTN